MYLYKKIIGYWAVFFIIWTLFIGCVGTPESISSKYEILPEKPDGYAISKRVLLVADNQLNHLYGNPIWLRNELFDHIVSVTIRPVQQDLFGQDILKWTLQYYGKRIPVVHLGDGTNMACAGEFESFREIMDTAEQPWVMAPGNHDAYLLGNLHTLDEDWWHEACIRADGPMTKDRFVTEYLAHLKHQHGAIAKCLDNNGLQGECRSDAIADPFLRKVAWKIDKEKPYRSYVVQELDLGRSDADLPVSAVLMDSSQYKHPPTLVPAPPYSNAGLSGSILGDQMEVAERWLKNDPTGKKLTILMIHHPYSVLLKAARKTIDGFREKYRIPLYISGHTHHGEYFVRGGDNGWIELNVGSMVDWPIEFRTFEIHQIIDNPKNLVFRTPLFRIPDIWDNAVPPRKPQAMAEWEIKKTDAPNFYLAHNYKSNPNPEKTQQDLLVSLLYTYKSFLNAVESAPDNTHWPEGYSSDQEIISAIDTLLVNKDIDAMTSFLIELGNFDKKRKPGDPVVHRDYRLYQAIWASKYDKLEGRKPVIADPYIRFPKGVDNE